MVEKHKNDQENEKDFVQQASERIQCGRIFIHLVRQQNILYLGIIKYTKVDDDDCADSQETYMVYVLIEKNNNIIIVMIFFLISITYGIHM